MNYARDISNYKLIVVKLVSVFGKGEKINKKIKFLVFKEKFTKKLYAHELFKLSFLQLNLFYIHDESSNNIFIYFRNFRER